MPQPRTPQTRPGTQERAGQERAGQERGGQEPGPGSRAVIAAGTRVHGRVSGDGDVTVEGHLEGEVTVRGELFIAEGGRVVSDIDASSLRVAGTL